MPFGYSKISSDTLLKFGFIVMGKGQNNLFSAKKYVKNGNLVPMFETCVLFIS